MSSHSAQFRLQVKPVATAWQRTGSVVCTIGPTVLCGPTALWPLFATAKYAGLPMEKVFVNVDKYGNMSSATVPIAFDEAREQGLIGEGSNVLTVAFGAGLTWGAMTLRL